MKIKQQSEQDKQAFTRRLLALQPRIEANKNMPMSNGKARLERRIIFCELHGIPYSKEIEGSTTILHAMGRKERFVTVDYRPDNSVMSCSKSVKKACDVYINKNGSPPNYNIKYKNHYLTDITDFILKGGRTLSYVDVDHCYWQLAYIHDIIDEKLYLKFKDNRQARLTAIGCRKRCKVTQNYNEYGRFIDSTVIVNPHEWLWHFVNWKAWCAMETCRKSFPIFSYHTDGCYLPDKYANKCQKLILDKYRLKSKIEKYKIIGWDGYYLVLEDIDNGKPKRTHMRMTTKIRNVLPKVDCDELKRIWKEANVE